MKERVSMYSNTNFVDEILQNKSIKSLIFLVTLGFFSVWLVLNRNTIINSLPIDTPSEQISSFAFRVIFTFIILASFSSIFRNQLVILFKIPWKQFKREFIGASIMMLVAFLILGIIALLICFLIYRENIYFIVEQLSKQINSNPGLNSIDPFSILSLSSFAIQLIGEELLFFSIFFLFYMSGKRIAPTGKFVMVFSIFISSIIFGLIHLPTYDYNYIQCLFVSISFAIRTSLFITYKNITICYLMHLIMDFLVVLK
ncbi:type II CAAX prenyl endopeptidase Rce1 family protein [Bacillus cereus]|uniref:CPBP family glutamic-type intramembrane protease n=1 Tax=Bacillus cereus TaxID=1396 RepID=UPI0039B6F539